MGYVPNSDRLVVPTTRNVRNEYNIIWIGWKINSYLTFYLIFHLIIIYLDGNAFIRYVY